jgi:hypothetical protein
VLTLQEVLVKPLREGQDDLAQKYRQVLTNSANVTLYEVDQLICETAADYERSMPGFARRMPCKSPPQLGMVLRS